MMKADPLLPVRDHLRQLRRQRGWSQKTLAERACIASNTVYLFERGADTRIRSVLHMALALGCELVVQSPKSPNM
jgi:transcriptional regulator with XRE-family HTH domain